MSEQTAFKKLFPVKHIPIILLSIMEAGSTLRKKTSTEREDLITNRLYRELGRVPVFRDGPLSIQLQPEILSADPEQDTPGGKIDLVVPSDLGNEVHFAIEAKRLRFPPKSRQKVCQTKLFPPPFSTQIV